MGQITERVDRMVIRVTSPDNNIVAEFTGGRTLTVAFRPGTYGKYSAPALAHQLSQLGPLVWTGYRRGLNKVISDVTGSTDKSDGEEWDATRRRYKQAQAKLEARAISRTRLARASAVGLLHWTVDLKDDALSKLSEAEFCAEVSDLVDRVLDDHNARIHQLQKEHLGLKVPTVIPNSD